MLAEPASHAAIQPLPQDYQKIRRHRELPRRITPTTPTIPLFRFCQRDKPTVVVNLDRVTINNSHDFIGSVTTEIFNLWLLFYKNAWTLPKGCIKGNTHKSYKAMGNSRRELQPGCLGYKDCSFEAISCKM